MMDAMGSKLIRLTAIIGILAIYGVLAKPQQSTQNGLVGYSAPPEQPGLPDYSVPPEQPGLPEELPSYSDNEEPPNSDDSSTQMQMVDLANVERDPETGKFCFMQKVCLANVETLVESFPELCPEEDYDGDDDDNDEMDNNGEEEEEEEDDDDDDLDIVVPDLGIECDCMTDDDCADLEFGRCVSNCVCRSCPSSTAEARALNPPLTFVVDTTKSVRPDRDSIFNLTQAVVARVQAINANIPAYQLVTFNDLGDFVPEDNFDVFDSTPDIASFASQILGLVFDSFDGGRDSRERLMQGLEAAAANTAEGSLLVVFTDNGSKDLELEQNVLDLKMERNLTIYIVLTPVFEGFPQDPSLGVYERVADEVFFIEDVGPETLISSVEFFEQTNCI